MADIIDDAQIIIDQSINVALTHIKKYDGVSAEHCDECGGEIPLARRVAVRGCTECVTCAGIRENPRTRRAS